MKVKNNLLFSNQSFADLPEVKPVVINLDTVKFISCCNVTKGLNQGPKTKVQFNDDTCIVIEESIEDIITELWQNYGED